ncbi:MAG: hypothetical protein JNL90_03710 [Planctomycetes bacterium]|nr:hypothetical protein [Planctomycetota bacterium]
MTRRDRFAPDPALPLALPLQLRGDATGAPPRLHDANGRLLALFEAEVDPLLLAGGRFAWQSGAEGRARARLFWPPRPAALLLFVDGASTARPFACDGVERATRRLLLIDPRTRAALSIEGEAEGAASGDAGADASSETDGGLRLAGEAGSDALLLDASATTMRFAFDAAAFALLEAAEREGVEAGVAKACNGGSALGLSIVAPSPRLQVVSWRADHAADEREQESLAQLVASRRAGTTLLLTPPDGNSPAPEPPVPGSFRPAPVAAALQRLVEGAPEVALEWEGRRAVVQAPIGRGRVVLGAADEWAAPLADATSARAIEAAIDAALVARASAAGPLARVASAGPHGNGAPDRDAPLQPLAHAPEWLDLHVALPDCAAAFRHEVDGGERVAPALPGAARHGWPTVGRLVRGVESFELAPWHAGAPPRRQLLVIERLTLAADAATLLRVELDDEDLGPWRLGPPSPDGAALDTFAIPADLLAGRDRFRLALRAASGEQVALRWRFFLEEELDGSWLDDLEWTPPLARRAVTHDVATRRRGRSVTLDSGTRAATELPRGYRELRLGAVLPSGSAGERAAFEVRLDGETRARVDWIVDEVVMPLDGARRLELAALGPPTAFVTLRDARLLR